MKKLIQTIILSIAATLMISTVASAEVYDVSEISRDFTNNTITVKGNADKGDVVTIRVKNGQTDEIFDSYVLLDEVETDQNGAFSYKFLLPSDASGKFSFYTSTKASENKSIDFYYGDSEDIIKTVDLINAASTADDVKKILTNTDGTTNDAGEQMNHCGNLFLEYNLFNEADKTAVAEKLIKELNKDLTADEIRDAILKISVLDAYNRNKPSLVIDDKYNFKYTDYVKIPALDKDKNVSAFKNYNMLTDNGKKCVTDSLFAKSYNSFDELYKDFAMAVIISSIRDYSLAGYAHIKDVLIENADFAGLDIQEYSKLNDNNKNKVSAYLANKSNSINSKLNLETYIKEAIKTINASPASTGSQGGGGGGVSSSSGIYVDSTALPNRPLNAVKSAVYGDVDKEHWAYDAILFVSKREIFSGDADGNFRPNGDIKREEFVKVLVNALDLAADVKVENCLFDDVSSDAWYKEYIDVAMKTEVVKGIDEKRFGVGLYITREDAVTMISRALHYKNLSLTKTREVAFDDNDKISDYASLAVEEFANAGIINGMEDNSFSPKSNLTRSQTAVILNNIIRTLSL